MFITAHIVTTVLHLCLCFLTFSAEKCLLPFFLFSLHTQQHLWIINGASPRSPLGLHFSKVWKKQWSNLGGLCVLQHPVKAYFLKMSVNYHVSALLFTLSSAGEQLSGISAVKAKEMITAFLHLQAWKSNLQENENWVRRQIHHNKQET